MNGYWVKPVPWDEIAAYESVGWQVVDQIAKVSDYRLIMRWMGVGDPTPPSPDVLAEYAELNRAFFSLEGRDCA